LNPLLDEDQSETYFRSHAFKMEQAVENVRALREAVGLEVDLCIEMHRRLNPAEAIVLGRAVEQFRPMFLRGPIRPNSFEAMARVADHIPIPVAIEERFVSLFQFQTLLTRHAVQYLSPSLCLCGGITGGKKIAALAEGHDAQIVPRNPLPPVCLAASLQLDACIPNFAIQEYPCATPDLDGRVISTGSIWSLD
jgi:galactonate dehydratase